MNRILLVEDEPSLRMGLADGLRSEGYEVEERSDGAGGLERALGGGLDAMVLDLMLPRLDGFEVLRRLRGVRNDLPVLVLSARGEESDRILGFEYGADDYVVKPAPLREVVLRLKAILRRAQAVEAGGAQPTAAFGAVEVDFQAYSLVHAGQRHGLNRKEVELLRYLLAHAGEDLSRARLLREVWGQEHANASRTVDTHVFRVRQKIETDPERPRHLLTVRGVGYRFEP
ncbi:MAG TPA: response regulator transcription factor [Planctomycetota bacterium]